MVRFDKYHTFSRRFFALIIDGLILSFTDELLIMIPESGSFIVSLVMSILISTFPYLYSIIMVGKYGQTVGKMLLRVKVVDNTTEKEASYNQAFMREVIPLLIIILIGIVSFFVLYGEDLENFKPSTFGYIILFLPAWSLLIWTITEIVTMFLNNKCRAFHDIIADTIVVKIEKEE